MNLLLVCKANVCRSSIAEHVFRHFLCPTADIEVLSAGLAAVSGVPIHELAKKVLLERGYLIPLESSATRLVEPMLTWAEVVLVMEKAQREEVVRRFPVAIGKVWMLGHWVGREIHDPVQGDKAMFDDTLTLIERCVSSWLPVLI